MAKKVALIIAHEGYQPVEYQEPKRILEQNGFKVVTASNKIGQAIAKDASTTNVDMLIQDVEPDQMQAIIFIGGPGAMDNLDNPTSYTLINETVRSGKLLGAICISTRILAHAGVLTNIHATGWNGDNELPGIYAQYDVQHLDNPVVYDQGILTATGPSAASEFGQEIVRLLKNRV